MRPFKTCLILILFSIVWPSFANVKGLSEKTSLNQDDSTKIFKYLEEARVYASQRDYEKAVELALKAASLSEKVDFEYGKYRSYKSLEILYRDAGKLLVSAKYKIKAMTSQSRLEAINYERDEKERIEKSEKERYIREQQRQLEIEQQELKLKMDEIAILEKEKKLSKDELDKRKTDIAKKQVEIENKRQTIDYQRETINSTFNKLSLTLEELETQRLRSKIFEDSLQMVKKNEELSKVTIEKQTLINYLYIVGVSGLIILAAFLYRLYNVKLGIQDILLKKNSEIEKEKEKNHKLLMNLLPADVIDELQSKGKYESHSYSKVTGLIVHLNNLNRMSKELSAEILVKEVDHIYKTFDEIIRRNNLEKIKSNGSIYLCASGLPNLSDHNPMNIIRAAKEIQEFNLNQILERKKISRACFEIRTGIHTGPVVAGTVGAQKISFDIWGDTVNTLSEIVENCESGKISISLTTYNSIKDNVECEYSGKLKSDGYSETETYYLNKIIRD